MCSKKLRITRLLVLAAILLAIVMVFGRKKKAEEEIAAPPATPDVQAKTIEQTTCPVMGGAIDTKYFAEYQGKKVYFCCPACIGTFEKEPEKYLDKLPQFKQELEKKASEVMEEVSEKLPELK